MFTGDQLKRKRKQQKLSAQQLADLLSVGKENVYKWEKGTKITDPEQYRRVDNWVNGKLENVPREMPGSNILEDSGEGLIFQKKPSLIESLMEKQNSLMEMQNRILSELKSGIQDKVKTIDQNLNEVSINLNTALGGVEQLSLHVESARVVVLESLSRLEKKPKGTLKAEADNIVDRLMKDKKKQSSRTAAGI